VCVLHRLLVHDAHMIDVQMIGTESMVMSREQVKNEIVVLIKVRTVMDNDITHVQNVRLIILCITVHDHRVNHIEAETMSDPHHVISPRALTPRATVMIVVMSHVVNGLGKVGDLVM
jgi:hypothetical protein